MKRRSLTVLTAAVAVALTLTALTTARVRAADPPPAPVGLLLRVRTPVWRLRRETPAGKETAVPLRAFALLYPGDRLRLGAGGSAEIVFSKTGNHCLISLPGQAHAPAVVALTPSGGDLPARLEPPLVRQELRPIPNHLSSSLSKEASSRFGPSGGVVTIRDLEWSSFPEDRRDVLLQADLPLQITWSPGSPLPEGDTLQLAVRPATRGVAAPIWSGHMTPSLAAAESLEGRIPGGILLPGQTYIWALTRPVAGDSQPVATGCLHVLSANERRGLSDLLDNAVNIAREGSARPGDATAKLLTAAAYLAYAMNTAAADYLNGALKQRSDNDDLRELATPLLHRPFSVRPIAPAPGTKSAAPAVGEAVP